MDFDDNNVRDDEDRLISLPRELIHQILSCFDTKFVVQTCLLLSPRWKLIWTSMPCLKFSSGDFKTLPKFAEFVKHVLSHRNHKVDFTIATVQELTVDTSPNAPHEFSPCLFSSQILKDLTFGTCTLEHCVTPKTPWDFPALTTLCLVDISLCDDECESVDLFSKCVNLQNLSLENITVKAKVFYIITPRLSNLRLRLINDIESNAIKVIAPQLENLTVIDCSIKELNIPSGFSSFYYKGYDPPHWFKGCFHSVNNVTVILSIYCPNQPYMQEDACDIVNMLQELRSAKFLTLNLDIVECISSFPDLLSGQSSPFSNLIRLKVECGTRDTSKVKLTTEARNFLLENSPTATFIVKEQPPREAMKEEKGIKEQIKAGIEDILTQLKASFDYENIIVEKKVAIKNLLDDIQEKLTKKKETQTESSSERDCEIDEIVFGLMLEFSISMVDINDMFRQASIDHKCLLYKTKQISCLMFSLPKRHREQMGAHSSQFVQIVAQGKEILARQPSHKDFVTKIVHAFKVSTSEYRSLSSSSSTIVEAMKEKEVKEEQKIKVEIEDILKDLQKSIELEIILNQKKLGVVKLLDDIEKICINKKDTQIESEPEPKMVGKLLRQFSEKLVDYTNMFKKVDNDLKPLSLKIEQASCLFYSMPKQQMMSNYFSQIVQVIAKTQSLTARIESHKDFLKDIADIFVDSDNKVSSTSEEEEDVPSTTHKHPLPSQTSSSSSTTTIVSTPSTSSTNAMP